MTSELIAQIFQICILPLLGILTTFIVKFVTAKINAIKADNKNELQNKYLTILNNTITDCVIATNQTYVESLKASGSFDMEAQKQAFNLTLTSVLTILNDDAKEVLTEAIGDLNVYISQKIEAEVKIVKDTPKEEVKIIK